MMNFFRSKPVDNRSETSPPDVIVPLHTFDDGPLHCAFVLYSLFVFEDALDVRKLRDGLERLVQRDGWQKLGARLRKDVIRF
ncbi:hypothetical protein B0J11DRAFT_517104 [Dendryphion nanum]|uniref:Uncharacterized protein n=1 Tax=Dendryphion nanum TaxID=256645 RepID=A0A9P9EKN5_9PLEO|nr:hypothetical protein B0J11DRAFT_517104 [Dendryphion nanum]